MEIRLWGGSRVQTAELRKGEAREGGRKRHRAVITLRKRKEAHNYQLGGGSGHDLLGRIKKQHTWGRPSRINL